MVNVFSQFYPSPFLAVQTSFWPFLRSLILFSLTRNIVMWVNLKLSLWYVLFSVLVLAVLMFLWFGDVLRESLVGYHTHKLEVSLRIGMLLFILSEVFFFFSFFWAYFDASLSPVVELGMVWPPKGIVPLEVYSVPLLNTMILLSRGLSVTWAHHALIGNFLGKTILALLFTVVLGAYFLYMQYVEYSESQFAIRDSIYGTTFFVATGFHGMHVMVGTIFLFYVMLSCYNLNLSYNHHSSFEFAAWYWHFVDVVWLFLFVSVYFWGRL